MLSDDQVLALSEVCWCCGDESPVAVATVPREGRVPVGDKCLEAFREAGVAEVPQFPKRCACGRVYRDAEDWGTLDYVGIQDDGVERCELRTCVCGSTIAIVIGPAPSEASTFPPAA